MSDLLDELLKLGVLIIEALTVMWLMQKNEPTIMRFIERLNDRLTPQGAAEDWEDELHG